MAAAATGVFLATIDGSIVNIALPTLETSLHTNFALVQWVVLAYMLTIATLMLSIGRLADMIGKKYIYLSGFIIFIIGSALCGLSNTIGMLIACRIFQAVGAAMTMALGTAIVTEAFPPTERGKAMGFIGLMVSVGAVAGPTLGGLILSRLTWHWLFFVNVPIGLIGVVMGFRFIPNRRHGGGEKFDLAGAVALFFSMTGFLIGLTYGEASGFGSPLTIGLLGLFVVALVIFILIEKRSPQPMIDLTLFKGNLFSINLITGFLTFVCSAGTVLLMPFFLQNVLMFSPGLTGLLLAVVPLSMGITAIISGSLSDRFGSRPLCVLGLVVLMGGYLAVSTLSQDITPVGYALRFLPIGIGMGLFQSPNNSAVMGTAPRHRLGVASGLLSLTRTLGQTTGLAIMGAIWAAGVIAVGGPAFVGDTTSAPAEVQVAALHSTVMVIVGVIGVGLLLSLWAWWKDKEPAALAE